MNPDPHFQQGIHLEIVWKSAEVQRFAVSLMERALAKGGHFTTDVVPESERGPGTGIAGSVVELLKNAGLIQPVGHLDSAGQWYALRLQSTRRGRNAAWLSVYQLTSVPLAQAFLKRHGVPPQPQQVEFSLGQST